MKTLMLLAILLVGSFALAGQKFQGKDLQCSLRDRTRTMNVTLDKTGNYAEAKVSYNSKHLATIRLYIQKSKKNMIFEMVHTGVAEQQVSPDGFMKASFTLIVPQVLQNGVRLKIEDDKGNLTEDYTFDCVRPDVR